MRELFRFRYVFSAYTPQQSLTKTNSIVLLQYVKQSNSSGTHLEASLGVRRSAAAKLLILSAAVQPSVEFALHRRKSVAMSRFCGEPELLQQLIQMS